MRKMVTQRSPRSLSGNGKGLQNQRCQDNLQTPKGRQPGLKKHRKQGSLRTLAAGGNGSAFRMTGYK